MRRPQPNLSIALSDPPSLTIDISPTLDVAYTPDDELEHWLIRAEPKATLNLGLKVNAQFEAKLSCKWTFGHVIVPIGGFLSWLFGGDVPFGLGFELAGKIVVATATLGGKVEATSTAVVGLACLPPAGCGLQHDLADVKVDPNWTFEPARRR